MNTEQIKLPIPVAGLNCIDDSLIEDNEAAYGTINISFKDNIPQTRKGYIKDNDVSFGEDACHTVFNFKNGTNTILLAACADTLLAWDTDDWAEVTDTLDSDYIECLNYPYKFPDPDTYGDKLFILDGKTYSYYDGTTFDDVTPYTTSPEEDAAYGPNTLTVAADEINKQRFILNDDNRVWVAGYKNIVRMSHLFNPAYFPTKQVWKLTGDCTGMARFLGEVFLFTENSITMISGLTPDLTLPNHYIYQSLPCEYGCSQHRSIKIGNGSMYWADRNGIYRLRYLPTGFNIPERISERNVNSHVVSIKPYIDAVEKWDEVFAEFYDNEYRLFLGDTAIGDNLVLIFNTINETWAVYQYDKKMLCANVHEGTLYAATYYMYQLDAPYVDEETNNGLSDDGVAIKFELVSKFFDMGKAANKKKFKKMYISLYSELISFNIKVYLNLDNQYSQLEDTIINKVSRWGVFAFGDAIQTQRTNLNYPVNVRHKHHKYNLQYRLVCDEIDNAFSLMSIILKYKIKELM